MKSLVAAVTKELSRIGYAADALLPDYSFADVLSPDGETRQVALAAFTQTPPSYRTAAFAVVEADSGGSDLIGLRALGAPMIFAIAGEVVELWQIHADQNPARIAVTPAEGLTDLFARHAEYWNPRAIHRAKAIDAEPLPGRQFDFVDMGLLIAIEGEIHVKLDALLREALATVIDVRGAPRWTRVCSFRQRSGFSPRKSSPIVGTSQPRAGLRAALTRSSAALIAIMASGRSRHRRATGRASRPCGVASTTASTFGISRPTI